MRPLLITNLEEHGATSDRLSLGIVMLLVALAVRPVVAAENQEITIKSSSVDHKAVLVQAGDLGETRPIGVYVA
jgi:hypothetical protein